MRGECRQVDDGEVQRKHARTVKISVFAVAKSVHTDVVQNLDSWLVVDSS